MPRQLEEKIDAVTASLKGERRVVTILCVQLAGATPEKFTDEQEDIYLLLDQLLQSLVEVVYEYEGHLDYLTNDGIQALFGAPITHENDPERALRAALDIVAQVQDYGTDWQKLDEQLQVRIGVHTGKVIVGNVNARWDIDYTIIGDSVKVAQELTSHAPWGEVLVSKMTYQYTRPIFRFQMLEKQGDKGQDATPFLAYCLQGLRQRPGRVRGLPGVQAPLIGRQSALSSVVEAVSRVKESGKPRVVLISGEAGVGKSRLVWEIRTAISAQNGLETAVYEGYSLSYARSRPYWVVMDLLRNIIGVSERDPAYLQFASLRSYLHQIGLWQDEVWPYLSMLLGIKHEDIANEVPVRVTDAGMIQRLIYAALRRVILAEAAISPIVIIFEDLHWIDKASWEFLRHLIQSVGKAQLLLLLVTRDEGDSKFEALQETVQHTDLPLTHIFIQPLNPDDGLRLVDELLHPALPELDSLKKKIAQLAAGNPFFTEEIIRDIN